MRLLLAALRPALLALIAVLAIGPATALRAAQPALEPYLGTFVGTAVVANLGDEQRQERDVEVVMEPYKRDGFRIRWTNVTRVDGRRDVRGVERHVGELIFRSSDNGRFFVEAEEYNPFREREETAPMSGDPVRWALLDAKGLHIYSFVVLEDGRYELQISTREPMPDGQLLHFHRVLDGQVVRRIEGRMVRVGE